MKILSRQFVAEGVLIVASILVAFSIDAWWDNLQDRKTERSAVQRLTIEFEENLRQLEAKREKHAMSLRATEALLAMVGPDQSNVPVISTIGPLLVQCLTNATFDPRLGTLNSLVSSGELVLVEDIELQSLLTEWPSAAQNLLEWQRIERENTEQFLLPFTLDYVAYPDVMLELALTDFDYLDDSYVESRFDSDFAALFSTLRFEGMLNNRRVNLKHLIYKAETLEKSTAAILERLADHAAAVAPDNS